MMTEKHGLVALCLVWPVLGSLALPRIAPSGDSFWWTRVAPWVLVAACPLAFGLGIRWAHRTEVLRGALTGLAVLLLFGGLLTPWRVHPNDLASLLALLLPWWLVPLALGIAHRRAHDDTAARWLYLVVTAGLAAALAWTGSRAGLSAALVGCLAGLYLGCRRSRLLVLIWILVVVMATAVVPMVSETDLYGSARSWLRQHDAEGFTWEHFTSGRTTIWRQALRIVEDFPLFGAGPSSFGALVPDIYPAPIRRIDLHDPAVPRSPQVDDAHNLYLESATTFGLPFSLAFLALCGLGLQSLCRSAQRERSRSHTESGVPFTPGSSAAFGGLLAYLLHGLVDCASPGTIVYVAGWAALGQTFRVQKRENTRSASESRTGMSMFLLSLATLVAAAIFWWPIETANHRSIEALSKSATHQQTEAGAPRLDSEGWGLGTENCRDAMWKERFAVAAGFSSTETATAVARCAPAKIADLAALSPFDARRAIDVLATRPNHPDALRWHLWAATSPSDLPSGYFRYLSLRPFDADAKMELLQRMPDDWHSQHPHLVLTLLAQSCAQGDPGANACFGAGNLARKLGLGTAVADAFYRASEWSGARALISHRAPAD
ncbi:MAG: O-antigen ligase family protein [Thermoanaerobaculia bacterium]|nr:O-antigen ligase family protein [Thermoanaerobaculia bacterium]